MIAFSVLAGLEMKIASYLPKGMRAYKVQVFNSLGKATTWKCYGTRVCNNWEGVGGVRNMMAGAFAGNRVIVEVRGPFGIGNKVVIDTVIR